MKILNSLAIAGLGIILSFKASAGTTDLGKVTCTAQYGEGYSWLVLSIETKEVCYRCTDPQIVTTATISVPYGPRGSYITQTYTYKRTAHNRLSRSTFQKRGQPNGHYSGDWGQWFPNEMEVISGSVQPLNLNFKGQSLDLKCKQERV